MNLNTVAALLTQPCQISAELTGICTDSRELKPGSLFIAIRGERFDGHDFIKEAEAQGAIAAVVNYAVDGVSMPQFVVPDPIQALAKIAAAHRQDIHCPVIALTGSNGKTTTKEMIAAILPSPSHATRGNFNNHIGAPLSVLQLNNQHRYAVFELGANHPGEIAHTVAIVHPDVTLINNIAPAHVEGFGSIDGVARAKGEIHQGLSLAGVAVVNDDDAYAHFWDELLLDKKVLRFSLDHTADVYAQDVQLDDSGCGQFSLIIPNGRADIHLKVPGLHNVRNALAAAACCHAVGISVKEIQQGLNRFGGVKGRLTVLEGKNQSTVIDDTYNANLRSVLAALEVLAECPGNKIFVFGDMGELGAWATQHHQEVGFAARRLGINQLLSCGANSKLAAESFGVGGEHFITQEQLIQNLVEKLSPDTVVLVKGSRSSAMEKIVHQLI
ncbi:MULTISPECIES: UDP-N-acetylmuramoyl-tripeptide--D-alanyl-D-alanine ligase [Legionella]|uniref:UDP-N-acetylmuramoyl-tripeptide--D-alanyl-D-alanine ligase n=1 Tax=Legionella steelei TaxID=947033 RepID=A0A0W0ZJ18_9GAMM|nr:MULTISPECIES: UDP-N-acetylmuramoyl-tripeptide--D-alanyl-D-alanine ligase [Legionella]KTD68774.1 UDP-N-acetylmuramoyl-tripeptide--D-alanyl-D- alani ne ligase [Legionella steelei]MBN9226805.1 UDP-N-acetylmuramoyl-tripeptide--D-alanyl-D-alanine ligase [Legionella steelei]OJW06646.1 MAG: UDP-N-acetylmuramoyl-tripeptide--D-alanyl-D-alanine ligase [Legionella sp. 39-23]